MAMRGLLAAKLTVFVNEYFNEKRAIFACFLFYKQQIKICIKQLTSSFILEHAKEITEEELEVNEILMDSMMFRLIQISENTA